MKLKINFVLKTGMEGEIPIIALINFGYKEFDALKLKYVYKPLKYYTGIKVTRQDWNDELKLPFQKSKQNELMTVQKTIEDVFQYLQMKMHCPTRQSGMSWICSLKENRMKWSPRFV